MHSYLRNIFIEMTKGLRHPVGILEGISKTLEMQQVQ